MPGKLSGVDLKHIYSTAVSCHIELKEKVEASNGHGNRRT